MPSGDPNEVIAHNGHQFVVTTLKTPHWCAHCNNFIWGVEKQCYACKSTWRLPHVMDPAPVC